MNVIIQMPPQLAKKLGFFWDIKTVEGKHLQHSGLTEDGLEQYNATVYKTPSELVELVIVNVDGFWVIEDY